MDIDTQATRQEIIEEYTPDYCSTLEVIYGEGMMSEGGAEGIEHMFKDVNLTGLTALDIGSGMGGVALYLANQYQMDVTGIDINPWMIAESAKRVPPHLEEKVRYFCTQNDHTLDFKTEQFDLIFSKGVLTHLEHKQPLFNECKRTLRPGGKLVITDWLSSTQGVWGPHMLDLMEVDGLTLFADTVDRYQELLSEAGFSKVDVRDDTALYLAYNQEILDTLYQEETKRHIIDTYGEQDYQANVDGYEAILKALDLRELVVYRFIAEE